LAATFLSQVRYTRKAQITQKYSFKNTHVFELQKSLCELRAIPARGRFVKLVVEFLTLHTIMPTGRFICFLFVALPFIQVVKGQDYEIRLIKEFYKQQDPQGCLMLFSDHTSNIQQIILIRHGEPDLDKKGWRNRKEATQYMMDYDSVGVVPFSQGPICTNDNPITNVFHSSMPRAKHTTQLAFGDQFTLIENSDFREFGRKNMKFCNIRLPLKFWTGGSRILWLLGLNDKGIETYKEARNRTQSNAHFLAKQSCIDQHIILVAHGLHNKYLEKYLKRMGWKNVFDNGNGYLSMKILMKEGN